MSRMLIEPVEGRDYRRLPNGSLVVDNHHDLKSPYQRRPIPNFLSTIDHSAKLSSKHYERRLAEEQEELKHLYFDKLLPSRRFVIIEANGRDSSGKTGLRKRVQEAIDSDCRNFLPVSFVQPNQQELAHFWLWKYTDGSKLPAFGQMRFWERGPCERLLVERVKKLAPQAELDASYAELNAWQWLLVRQGGIYIKLWLDITKDEQARRFKKRQIENPQKLSSADFEARADWHKYTPQINEMLARIGTDFAAYHIISGENKRLCRVSAFEIINARLRAELT